MASLLTVLFGSLSRPINCRRLVSSGIALLLLGTAAPALAHVQDDFARADGAVIGNGWVEKNAGAFSLVGGRAAKQLVGTVYRDNLVYRPAAEDVLNVDAAIELQITSASPGYPQLVVRLQSATAANADVFDAYVLYINNSTTQAILGRQNGNAFVATLTTLNLTTALNTTDRFRLRLRATGTNPVQLDAYVERLVGVIWTTIGQASFADSAAARIAAAGSTGFGGYTESSYLYDNFVRVDLGAVGTANPPPATAALSPTQANAGETGLTLVVYGSGFTTDSAVRWNNAPRTTTYVSPSELEAAITTADLANPGSASVTVVNPTPGGGTSNAQSFSIANPGNPAPSIAALVPASTLAGGTAFTLTVQGTGFDGTSVVRWNGVARTTTFISANELRASISAADIAAPASVQVSVLRNSDSLTSGIATFNVNPVTVGDFFDSFDRANSGAVGNSWIEKDPAAFEISGNEVARPGIGTQYHNNVVYRPASENLQDVEAATEFRFLGSAIGYPQMMVRVQTTTVATAGQLDAYLLYVNNSTSLAVLSRQRGSAYDTALAYLPLSPALNSTDRYRMRLRATGTNPVQLAGYIERWNGSAWQIIGQATVSDSDANRIAAAGSVGFGGDAELNYRYDNFSRTNLGSGSNPLPAIGSLSPSSTPAGSGAMTLTVNGSGFVAGSVVQWNGSARGTTFLSPTQLQAAIASADLTTAGNASVTVFNPAPGGGTSGASIFTIATVVNNPVPAVSSLSPSSANAGSSAFTLTVNGSNFVSNSVVRWNGSNRTTTFVTSTQLTAAITTADVASAGTPAVSVFNPSPGGGTSGNLTFTVNAVNNPVPVVSNLSPSSTPAGGAAFTLSVNGSNFVAASTVRWNGSNRSTTVISATQLTAAISASDIASQGSANVSVFNPSPGGGTSGNLTFTIGAQQTNNPLPVLNSISPQTWPNGGSAFTLTVTGSGFNGQSVVHWNGAARGTTMVSANELRANISTADVATAGLATVTVFAPTPGGGRSTPLTFFKQGGSVQFFSDAFNRANNTTIGNGWTEKNPSAFEILGSELVSVDTPNGFVQDLMYRPQSEDRLNTEASVEFRRLSSGTTLDQANYPQLHSRVQSANVATPWTLNSYIFFIDDFQPSPAQAMFAIMRSPAGQPEECYLATVPLPAPLTVGSRYRLRFRVSGTSTVSLWGAVDQYSNGNWTTLATGTFSHSPSTPRNPALFCETQNIPSPITTAGMSALAKWVNRTDVYDNFYWREYSGP